jgi:hypothetical protein
MPQARSSSGKSPTTGAKPKTAGAQTKRPAARATAAKSAGASAKPPAASSTTRATRATGAKATATASAKTTKPAPSAKSASGPRPTESTSAAHAAEARLDAAAQRVRKLNERIIEAGRDAGETTLTSYEKALKSIAGTIERRADSTEIDWISNLATTQAKFIRDVTDAWTKAAREMLKK